MPLCTPDAGTPPATTTVLAHHAFSACGQPGALQELRIHYTAGRLPDDNLAVAVVSPGAGRRPASLVADISTVLGAKQADQVGGAAEPTSGCAG